MPLRGLVQDEVSWTVSVSKRRGDPLRRSWPLCVSSDVQKVKRSCMVNDCLESEPPRDPSIGFGLAKAREVLKAGCSTA
jgi:hypothetical protein